MNEKNNVLPYETSMKLKKLGYNEFCECMYETARRHFGADLGFDEEYELKAEGHGDEIEYIPGGWLNMYHNRNDCEWLYKDNCSAPYIEDVVNWLEEKHGISVYVKPDTVNGWDEELNSFATYSRGWKVEWIKKAETGTISIGYLDGYFATRAEALKSGVEKIIDGLG